MQDQIIQAVHKLDAKNDDHWLDDGRPNPTIVAELANNPAITSEYVEWACPGYKRPEIEPTAQEVTLAQETNAEETVTIIADGATAESISDELALVNTRLADAKRVLADAQEQARILQEQQDALAEQIPQEHPQQQIREYLNRQIQLMEDRADKIRFVQENKELVRDLLRTRSPLDAALANRRRRGH